MRRTYIASVLVGSLILAGCGSGDTGTSPRLAQEDILASATAPAAQGRGGKGNGGGSDKVDICHLDDTGAYVVLNISANAVQGHRRHGDGFPGEQVPGRQQKFLGDCEPAAVGPGADVMGPPGGSVSSADGNAELSLPEGALREWTLITIRPVDEPAPPFGSVPGALYEFEPNGLRFDEPVTLSIKYSPSAQIDLDGATASAGQLSAFLRIVKRDSPLPPFGSADTGSDTVSGTIGGFSRYGAATVPATADGLCSQDPSLPFCAPPGPACSLYEGSGTRTNAANRIVDRSVVRIGFERRWVSDAGWIDGTLNFASLLDAFGLTNITDSRVTLKSPYNSGRYSIAWTRTPDTLAGSWAGYPRPYFQYEFSAECVEWE